jgi:two-component system, OmpR family, phosphate regulon response regulator PhoB
MAKEKILIIEDDKDISRLVQYNLEKAGFVCAAVFSGENALEALKTRMFHLLILDVMLPGVDGLEVCRLVRQNTRTKNTPIIMLTAKGEEVDKVVGLELGADDYVVKPFSPRELVLRVKAILRRGKPADDQKETLEAGLLVVDRPRHQVTVSGKEVELTPMEFKLLVTLMERSGRVQTREALLDDVWGMNAVDVFTRTVDTHIKRLREKLGKAGKEIETVTGLGYRFRAQDDED